MEAWVLEWADVWEEEEEEEEAWVGEEWEEATDREEPPQVVTMSVAPVTLYT